MTTQYPDFDFSKAGKRWVAYFDLLGFKESVKNHSLIDVHGLLDTCLSELGQSVEGLPGLEFTSMSDTFLLYTADLSRRGFCAITCASRAFCDELSVRQIPIRGAVAFGELYADRAKGLFFGKALNEAYEWGEMFQWVGLVLHPTALTRMKEVGQAVSKLYYKRWPLPFKDRKTKTVRTRSVVAYLMGPGSIMPVVGGNPYLEAFEEMAARTKGKDHKRKPKNTIEFIKHFAEATRPPGL